MSSTDSSRPEWITDTFDVVRGTYENWRDTRTIRLGAGVAYYGLFAVVPLVTLSIWFAQLVVGDDAVSSFLQQVGSELNIDEEGIAALTDTVNASSTQASMGLIGFFSLAFAAVLVFVALQDAFDELWGLPVARGLRKRTNRRRNAFLVAGGAWTALVLALAINALADFMKQVIPGEDTLLDAIPGLFRIVSGWVVMLVALAVIYQMLTRKKIGLSALVVGSLATALLLAVGTQVLDWYLANYAATSLTGAVGSVLVALLWLYYVAQMILIGANLIRVLDERRSGQLAQVKAG